MPLVIECESATAPRYIKHPTAVFDQASAQADCPLALYNWGQAQETTRFDREAGVPLFRIFKVLACANSLNAAGCMVNVKYRPPKPIARVMQALEG